MSIGNILIRHFKILLRFLNDPERGNKRDLFPFEIQNPSAVIDSPSIKTLAGGAPTVYKSRKFHRGLADVAAGMRILN